MRFAIFGKVSDRELNEQVIKLFHTIASCNDEISVESRYLEYVKSKAPTPIPYNHIITGADFEADVVMSIGGDGTFLRTAARVGAKQIPMVGINTGRLGFLADIAPDNIESTISQIHKGDFIIQKRDLLEIHTDRLPDGFTSYALNDIAILKHDIASMISIDAYVDGTHLTTYLADGVVIATPTGSTAYSLSIGGPVIAPGTNVIELTPVAPHSLTMRSIVISNDRVITLSVNSRSHSFLVSIDGNSFSCPEGTRIEIRKAPFQISVLKPCNNDFFATLRDKMMWGTDSRQ